MCSWVCRRRSSARKKLLVHCKPRSSAQNGRRHGQGGQQDVLLFSPFCFGPILRAMAPPRRLITPSEPTAVRVLSRTSTFHHHHLILFLLLLLLLRRLRRLLHRCWITRSTGDSRRWTCPRTAAYSKGVGVVRTKRRQSQLTTTHAYHCCVQ